MPRLHRRRLLRRCGKRDQVRHGDLVRHLCSVRVGEVIEMAGLQHGPAVCRGVRGVRQPRASLRRLAQVMESEKRQPADGGERQAGRQRLALLEMETADMRGAHVTCRPWRCR
ncbi:hypothetical protein [Achromobacter sp. DMS1]|uniref:hypothetical protein n=1 Tax=Achromobacter sp. DMS1 TaxID=1688405 RepID=UPI001F476AC9|nr:hypothetical protein [Achromobacter sp. DMS1]